MSHESADADAKVDEDGNLNEDGKIDVFEGPADVAVTRRWNIRVVFGTLCVLALMAVMNAPYEYVEIEVTGDKPTDDFDMVMEDGINGVVTEAGWPLRYLVQHDFANNVDSKQWFFGAAAIDLVLTISVIGLVCWYLRRGTRASQKKPSPNAGKTKKPRRVSLSLSDLLVLIGLIALPMGYWKHQQHIHRVEKQFEKQVSSKAAVQFRFIVPRLLIKRAPQNLLDSWRRITKVDIQQPSQEDLEAVCRLPHLRSLRIGGGEYETTPLRRLPSMRYLVDLRIAGRAIDAATVQSIARCQLVSHLNIAKTNCNENALRQFATMPRLKRLCAFGCDVPNEAWTTTPLKDTLVELHIDRPDTGQAGEVVFQSWPQLQQLFLQSRDQFVNHNVFDVTVSTMPQLEHLEIDVFQLHDLTLSDLPKLPKIDAIRRNPLRRVADGERAPVLAWTRNLRLTNVPLMERVDFDPQSFESITIKDCEKLAGVVANSYSQLGSEDHGIDYTHEKSHREKLIQSYAKLSGPTSISLFGLRLDDLDLSPLASNERINELNLGSSIVSVKNVQQLSKMPSIKRLTFNESQIEPKTLGIINNLFPKLESLVVPNESTAIRLEDKPELTWLSVQHYENRSQISALRLVNVPKLVSPMIVSEMGNYFVVKNAPKIKGLAALRPIPTADVSQVDSLEWFVAGGATLSDGVVREVLKAKGLQSLTLAYPVASEAAFADLIELKNLVKLEAPGAPLTDALMQSWELPRSLSKLNLDDCKLSDSAIGRILDHGNWQELSLKGNTIAEDSLPLLAKSRLLTRLGLGRTSLSKETVDKLPPFRFLSSIDLSDGQIAKGALAALADKCSALGELDLSGATVDPKELMTLARGNPGIKFKMEPTDATVAIITYLTSEDRLVRERDPWMVWSSSRQLRGYDAAGRPVYTEIKLTDVEFEVPTLDLGRFRMMYQRGQQGPKPTTESNDELLEKEE
ncbi:MAG: hypothetical protein WBD20_26365 [Pirellulaceae bacterium]